MKPWSDEYYEAISEQEMDREEEKALWLACKAEEFLFATTDAFSEGDEKNIIITPKEFFEKEEYPYDQHLDIDHLLPEYLQDQMCEAIFNAEGQDINKVIADLKQRGFEYCEALEDEETG